MEDIVLNVPWDDDRLEIKLSEVVGTGSIWWNVIINMRVYGSVYHRYGKWIAEMHKNSEFTADDAQIMIELIAAKYDFDKQ